ncbi:DNA methyltransferase [Pseudoalteromonas sp. RB2-MNA-CIBAN-0110]|uniref:Eco57I restriction-modification methylase domain-containing protein n=1 Tax=Pseudoalteromonas sp. RB2-MNA-CIBAN-0110 TaxID=3140439 RepID=UPI00331A9489
MRTALDKTLRGKLEKAVEKARDIVEIAVTEALTRLGISDGSAPSYLSDEERKLRNRLRAHSRQLGDVLNKDSGKQETELLINEMAYEHWHRMLFARFLEQSDLLMYEPGTPVSLQDCADLAEEEPDIKDGWELAGRLAQKMLPQIFRADSPVFEVKLSINHVNTLEDLIAKLHEDTFQASDALGWCYQFWQNKKKKQVNESGVKIGAKELSPVTQLFTEPYMVSFLLDNALGAWWAKRRLSKDDLLTATSEQELRELAAIPGVPLEYLRFTKAESKDEETSAHSPENAAWSLAAGDFDKWPDDLSEFKTLDPCCGSGHFLVAKFLMLVPIRMELEGLTAKEAIDKVIAENIHGLELDQRCVELAAFALALEAWRYPSAGGYRQLPELQLACSGMSITEAQKEWKDLANDDEELQGAIKWMQQTFQDAPTLGSLIDPTKALSDAVSKPWEILQRAIVNKSNTSTETIATAQGLAIAAELLTRKYEWVVTNVPYLNRSKQNKKLQFFCEKNYGFGKGDLANVFLERCLELNVDSGITQSVMPHNWLFLGSYSKQRKYLLQNFSWGMLARLGGGGEAFRDGPGNKTNISLFTFICEKSADNHSFFSIDAEGIKKIEDKEKILSCGKLDSVLQKAQLRNPDQRITFQLVQNENLLAKIAECYQGMLTGDKDQFYRKYWEINKLFLDEDWDFSQTTNNTGSMYGGLTDAIYWQKGVGRLSVFAKDNKHKLHDMHESGNKAWGRQGVALNQQDNLKATPYLGCKYDGSVSVLFPKNKDLVNSIYTYCSSPDFSLNVRKIDKKLNVTNATFLKVPFEQSIWEKNSYAIFNGKFPSPFSNDLKQWIFHGHACASINWDEETKSTTIGELRQDDTVLQVAVARLLGYRWPAELDDEMELAPEMREVIEQNKVFDDLVDDDGIVCIPAIRGEKPAVDRLETILHAAYGDEWSATVLNNLLKTVKSRDLNLWLRDKFFDQHSKLFQHRPFIWQIWDGLPDGFSALVNYHQLDYKGLERLIYTYLDDWISTQIQLEKDSDEGAEIRLAAARNLREQLEDILVGEEGLDIFVRWKSLEEQPIGWNPDLNDGVRLNIRPFMKAKDIGKKDAGILRSKPNIHWKKDRGTDVKSAPWYDLGLEYGGKQGDRINDHHLTLAEKKAARDKV